MRSVKVYRVCDTYILLVFSLLMSGNKINLANIDGILLASPPSLLPFRVLKILVISLQGSPHLIFCPAASLLLTLHGY